MSIFLTLYCKDCLENGEIFLETTNIGIKLGYSDCMVACLDEHFQPEVIMNTISEYTTPSVVNLVMLQQL